MKQLIIYQLNYLCKHLLLFLISMSPFLSFAQKEKSYRHHDIDAGITSYILDDFKIEGHDGYIRHDYSAFNFRVSYAYSLFSHLAVGVNCVLYSVQESLSGLHIIIASLLSLLFGAFGLGKHLR